MDRSTEVSLCGFLYETVCSGRKRYSPPIIMMRRLISAVARFILLACKELVESVQDIVPNISREECKETSKKASHNGE